MGNVLGTLFGEIAREIRKKNPNAGTMKPVQFPAAIEAIEAGVKDPILKIASGSIEPQTNDPITITHDLGVLPDIVVVYLVSVNEGATISSETFCMGGETAYSDEVMSDGVQRRVYNIGGSSMGFNMGIHIPNDSTTEALGCVRAATPRTFLWGGSTQWPMHLGAEYNWIALGGIKVHPAYLNLEPELDGDGGLIIHGGVPEISQLEIYVDGTLAKTVDYIHGEGFRVNILDIAPDMREYIFSVKAVGEGLDTAYKYQFFESVTGAPIDISMEGTCGENATFNLDNTGTMTISGTGEMTSYSSADEQPWASRRNSIKKVVISSGITTVGKYAFSDCAAVTEVRLSYGITNLDNSCFNNCTALAAVTLPTGLQRIGSYAFYKTAITSISIPYSVTVIGAYSFADSALKSMTVARNSVTWYSYTRETDTSHKSSVRAGYFTADYLTQDTTKGRWWKPAS